MLGSDVICTWRTFDAFGLCLDSSPIDKQKSMTEEMNWSFQLFPTIHCIIRGTKFWTRVAYHHATYLWVVWPATPVLDTSDGHNRMNVTWTERRALQRLLYKMKGHTLNHLLPAAKDHPHPLRHDRRYPTVKARTNRFHNGLILRALRNCYNVSMHTVFHPVVMFYFPILICSSYLNVSRIILLFYCAGFY